MIKGLPAKLKKHREKHGLSQKQVAERLSVSPSIISGYETGERTPSVEILLALSYLYNCSTDYLLGRSTEQPRIMLNADGLTDEQIKAMTALIDSIKNK